MGCPARRIGGAARPQHITRTLERRTTMEWSWPFISRRRHKQEMAFIDADRERLRGERTQFAQDRDTARFNREQVVRQNADLDAANRRLMGRNIELGRRLASLAESDPEYAAKLEQRVERLRKAGVRVLAAWYREQTRADRLQTRLDDAVGLGSARPLDSSTWQPGYVAPKQDPKPEAAS